MVLIDILAVQKRTTGYGDLGLPDLLNVVDLGAGRTGIIVEIGRDASRELVLADYRDGAGIESIAHTTVHVVMRRMTDPSRSHHSNPYLASSAVVLSGGLFTAQLTPPTAQKYRKYAILPQPLTA